MKKLTNIRIITKTSYLLFLMLTINLVLSSSVISNDNGGDVSNPNASYSGERNFAIQINESQFVTWNVQTESFQQFTLDFNGWWTSSFDIKVSNITENKTLSWVIQNETIPDNKIPVRMHGFDYNNGTYIYQPQEVGTNFYMKNPSYVQYIYLNLGFHVLDNAFYTNLEETRYMINNATIDIRNDDGSANGAPMDEYIVSVPLSQCVVTWDENTGSTYVGSTIGNAITSNPEEGMLSNVIIQVPVDYNLEPGNYWTVFKSNTVHVLRNQTENSDLFRIDVFAHNNNSDDSHFVYRSHNSADFIGEDGYSPFQEPLYDIYQTFEKKNLDYIDPADVGFLMEGYWFDTSKYFHYDAESYNSRQFSVYAQGDNTIYAIASINSTLKRGEILTKAVSYQTVGNFTEWTGSVSLSSYESGKNKNTTIKIPAEWDINSLQLKNQLGVPLTYTIVGQDVIVQNTESVTAIQFSVRGLNAIQYMITIDEKVIPPSTITIKCIGTKPGKHLKLDLFCNGSLVETITTTAELNEVITYDITADLPEGTGYTVRAFWDDGSNLLGNMESNSFRIGEDDTVIDNPENPNDNGNPFGDWKLEQGAIVGIVAVVSALSIFQIIKKGKKKMPKLHKIDVAKISNEKKDDEWF